MFWNARTERWEHHPLCRCHNHPCYCPNLPMLDADGTPIGTRGVLGPDYPAKPVAIDQREKDVA